MSSSEALVMDAGLARTLPLAVMRLRRRLLNERHPDNDLSLGAMAVAAALEHHGDMALGALAQRERVRPPSMTRTVNCLEEGGYVVRRPGETDRRQVIVSLTDKGRETLRVDRARRTEWLAQRLGQLDEADRAILSDAIPLLEMLARA